MVLESYLVHNPHGKPVEELPIIYGAAVADLKDLGVGGKTITQEGMFLANWLSSNEEFLKSDLGIVEGGKASMKVLFDRVYPDGYRTEYVSLKDHDTHPVIGPILKAVEAKVDADIKLNASPEETQG